MQTRILLAGFTLTALFSAGTAFGADPRLLNLVMPNAGVMAGANVTNAETTPFGQYVLAQIAAAAQQPLQEFITATGFDPIHDVSEILAASSGTAANPSGIVMAVGNFPVAQLTAAIASKAPNLTVGTYGGATLISGTAKKGPGFSVGFLGGTIAIAGDTPSVKATIDRSAGVNSIDPALAVEVQNLSTTEDAWALTNSPVASLIPGVGAASGTGPASGTGAGGLNQLAPMFSSIQSSSGGIKFGSVIQITGQAITNDPANATALANVAQALVSIVSMSGAQNPEMSNIAQILQGLKVTADGTAINLALSIPEAQVENILNSLKQARPVVKPAMLRVK